MSDMTPSPTRSQEANPVSSARDVATYFLVQADSQVDLGGLVADVHRLPGVITAMRVVGPYDVIAEASGRSDETRASLAAEVAGIPGVIRVVTMPTSAGAGQSDDSTWAA